METKRFAEQLPLLFGGDVMADHPSDRRFKAVMDDVPGMSSENALALLHLAANLLSDGEAYLEVGSYKGLTLTAAMLGNSHVEFHAIESFREFGVDPEETKAELFANLGRWVDASQLTLHVGDAFRLLSRPGLVQRPVGVYFYDGNHSRTAHALALAMAEPFLADEALVIVDDASWPTVSEPTERYVARNPAYELLFDLPAKADYEPRWWNGVKVYRYMRPDQTGARPTTSPSLWLRRAWYLWIFEPAWYLGSRFVSTKPKLSAFLRKILPTKGLKR